MFEKTLASFRFNRMADMWEKCTCVNPADNGQIASKAIYYMDNLELQPEDVWLAALTFWMNGMPWPESKVMMASALIEFLNTYEGKIKLSRQIVASGRAAAETITESYVNPGIPGPVNRPG